MFRSLFNLCKASSLSSLTFSDFLCSGFAGRMFDFQVLDMVELGVDKFTSMFEIEVGRPAR